MIAPGVSPSTPARQREKLFRHSRASATTRLSGSFASATPTPCREPTTTISARSSMTRCTKLCFPAPGERQRAEQLLAPYRRILASA